MRLESSRGLIRRSFICHINICFILVLFFFSFFLYFFVFFFLANLWRIELDNYLIIFIPWKDYCANSVENKFKARQARIGRGRKITWEGLQDSGKQRMRYCGGGEEGGDITEPVPSLLLPTAHTRCNPLPLNGFHFCDMAKAKECWRCEWSPEPVDCELIKREVTLEGPNVIR